MTGKLNKKIAIVTDEEITVDSGQLSHLPTYAQLMNNFTGGFAVAKND